MKRIISICLISIMGICLLTSCGNTITKMLKNGQYQEAYEKAKDEEKNSIIIESNIASCAKDSYEAVLESETFSTSELLDAYYLGAGEVQLYNSPIIALHQKMTTVDGQTFDMWVRFRYSGNGNWGFIQPFVYGDYDDYSSGYDVSIEEEGARIMLRAICQNGTSITSDAIDRINALIKDSKTIVPIYPD